MFKDEDLPAPEVVAAPTATPTGPKPNTPPRPTIMSELPAGQPTKTGYITKVPNQNGGMDFSCIIDFFVDELTPYYPLLEVLYNATEKDTITLRIYSYGGSVETGVNIMNGIFNCKAKVTTIAYGICASIGAMIWSCGHERIAMDNATIMFHMPSGFSYGKTADNEEEARHMQTYFAQLMRKVAQDILTEEQFDRIINRRTDIFIPAEVIQKIFAEKCTKTEGDASAAEPAPVSEPAPQPIPIEPAAPAAPVPPTQPTTEGGL